MNTSLATAILLRCIFLMGVGLSWLSPQASHFFQKSSPVLALENNVAVDLTPTQSPSSDQKAPNEQLALPSSGQQPIDAEKHEKRPSIWSLGNSGAALAVVSAIFSLYFFIENRKLSRGIADRTVTFEAQKLLLEINKQFIADPTLFAIYDDDPKHRKALENDSQLKAKVDALGYMKLNVFEVIFAQLPDAQRDAAWNAYFLDSLDRCSVLAEELRISKPIYHPKLVEAYEKWERDKWGRSHRAIARKAADPQSHTTPSDENSQTT
jgi:hypothetical protein